MPLSTNLQTQDYQFRLQTLVGFWRWVTRLDVSRSTPTYEVRDIYSPYGLLRDSIPIPGEVIQAMAQSIAEIQSAFAPNIFIAPTSLVFDVDEGRGFGTAQQIQITNNGVFGSLLTTNFTTTNSYIRISPSSVGGLSFNETGIFEVNADSTHLLAINSPYAGSVTIQDPAATNNPVVIPITVNVRPKAHIQISPTALTFYVTKPITGPFPAIPSQMFVLQNTGLATSVLDYLIQRLTNCSPWIASISPISGQLPGGGTQNVLVTVAPTQDMLTGTYTETLRVSGYSDNYQEDVLVTLVIS